MNRKKEFELMRKLCYNIDRHCYKEITTEEFFDIIYKISLEYKMSQMQDVIDKELNSQLNELKAIQNKLRGI